MAIPNAHCIAPVVFNTTVLGGITRQSINLGNMVRSVPTAGAVTSKFVALYHQSPTASFQTLNVGGALDLAGYQGTSIAGLAAGLIMYAMKKAEGGTRTSGTAHRKYVFREGLVIPRTLTANHGEDATLDYDVIGTYDGSNLPVVETDSVALPTSPDDALRWTLHSATLESEALTGIQGFTLDFGISAAVASSDGDLYPTFSCIDSQAPRITLRGIDTLWLASGVIPKTGLAITQANTSIFLKKRTDGGTFVADITAEHIKLTAAGMAVVQNAFDGSGNENATCDIEFTVNDDGTNAALLFDTTNAIS